MRGKQPSSLDTLLQVAQLPPRDEYVYFSSGLDQFFLILAGLLDSTYHQLLNILLLCCDYFFSLLQLDYELPWWLRQ